MPLFLCVFPSWGCLLCPFWGIVPFRVQESLEQLQRRWEADWLKLRGRSFWWGRDELRGPFLFVLRGAILNCGEADHQIMMRGHFVLYCREPFWGVEIDHGHNWNGSTCALTITLECSLLAVMKLKKKKSLDLEIPNMKRPSEYQNFFSASALTK